MSIKFGAKIGEGKGSEVFEWENEHKIVKLAKPNTNRYSINLEYENSRLAWQHGLPVPRPFAVVDIDGRPGIVFERVYGEPLMKRFMNQIVNRSFSGEDALSTGENDFVRITARILYDIHQRSNVPLPSQRHIIKRAIESAAYLTADEKSAVLAILDALPEKKQLCHGDPNPGNILIRDGKGIVIDWVCAATGNPEADLAEYIIMIRYAVLLSYFPKLPGEAVAYFDTIRESIVTIFMDEYSKMSGTTYDDIDAWIAPIAARKLTADVCEAERNLLLHEIRRRL
ncbi:aminoglycoside phosphotransferase family protein [Paenibacillus allorhizosphaerae]|uniref:Aminoglycoside phosphotransferase domain-containing protein n=1 Tax=Paenibacillus allorhizosphaerae TaxID=2849866 RepID=A0ABN7TG20_9BACL|nr:aminoglycoside phosphotransferase family protein [Paenibacillus allorhizosphaerae]CAG7626381.1 hypothetical protein PAECIP111802_01244 [Paenibacillus allorhizosphaerae]